MEARKYYRNRFSEVKYEAQIYWFVLSSLVLALMLATNYLRGAAEDKSSKRLQLPAATWIDGQVASREPASIYYSSNNNEEMKGGI